jgi:hypothetical protein
MKCRCNVVDLGNLNLVELFLLKQYSRFRKIEYIGRQQVVFKIKFCFNEEEEDKRFFPTKTSCFRAKKKMDEFKNVGKAVVFTYISEKKTSVQK